MSEFYLINDMVEFCKVLLTSFKVEDVFKHITLEQFEQIIKNHSVLEDNGKYSIKEVDVNASLDEAWEMVVGSILSKMASDGLLECAWDEEKQDMIFWAK